MFFSLIVCIAQLPCIMWLAIYKPRRYSLSWTTNWVCSDLMFPPAFFPLCSFQTDFDFALLQICIILGVLLMVLAPIGGLRQIILQAKDYDFYS